MCFGFGHCAVQCLWSPYFLIAMSAEHRPVCILCASASRVSGGPAQQDQRVLLIHGPVSYTLLSSPPKGGYTASQRCTSPQAVTGARLTWAWKTTLNACVRLDRFECALHERLHWPTFIGQPYCLGVLWLKWAKPLHPAIPELRRSSFHLVSLSFTYMVSETILRRLPVDAAGFLVHSGGRGISFFVTDGPRSLRPAFMWQAVFVSRGESGRIWTSDTLGLHVDTIKKKNVVVR